jgi:hypothetical protein
MELAAISATAAQGDKIAALLKHLVPLIFNETAFQTHWAITNLVSHMYCIHPKMGYTGDTVQNANHRRQSAA